MGEGLTPDELLRGNIGAAMGRLQLTQPELARRMKKLGYNWIRQTVGDVQTGRRSLRAAELYGLSVSLEVSIATLMAPQPDEDERVVLPSGRSMPAASVRRSARGQTRGAVRWGDDGDPIFPPEEDTRTGWAPDIDDDMERPA